MKPKTKSRGYKRIVYIFSPLLTIGIIFVVYSLKGIYPFGSGTIVDMDLFAISVPVYTNYYDIFHKTASAFIDWFTAAGVERFSLSVLLSPSIYFLLCFSRDMLFNAFSLLFVIKMAVIAFTSSIFFKKVFPKLPPYWIVIFALMYTFSGFDLQYYTNMEWLDVVALFPILILTVLRMFKGKSILPFTLCMTYLLVTNVYCSFFIFLFLVLVGGLYVFIYMDKKDRKEAVFKLGAGAAASLAVSAPVSLHSLYLIFSSSRFKSVVDGSSVGGVTDTLLDVLNTPNTTEYPNKILMLVGLEFAFVTLVLLWAKYKRDKKAPLFFTSAFLILGAQILFENINLIWHGGSYMRFPFRNGYMLSFIMVCCAAYYCERYDILRDKKPKFKALSYLLPALSVISLYIIVPYCLVWAEVSSDIITLHYNSTRGYSAVWTFFYTFVAALCGFVLYRFIGSRKFRTGFTALLITVVISINAYGFIGAQTEGYKPGESYKKSFNAALCEIVRDDDVMNRVTRTSVELMPNYAYPIRRASLSNWTHTLNNNHRQALWDLGFSSCYTAIFDMGGTAFSKALMNIRNTLSYVNMPDKLYTLVGEDEYGCRYYDNRFALPLGLVFDGTLGNIAADGDFFEYQNRIYTSLSGDTSPLFTKADITDKKYEEQKASSDTEGQMDFKEKTNEYVNKKYPLVRTTAFTVSVGEKSVLYFKGNFGEQVVFKLPPESESTVTVNGEPYVDEQAARYPTEANDNMLELGIYENEKVTVEIISRYVLYETEFYTMDYAKLEALCMAGKDIKNSHSAGNRDFTISVSSDADGKYLFLPIAYSGNWSCTVNGEAAAVEKVLGNFIAVKLLEGENTVALKLSVYKSFIRYGASGVLLALLVVLCVILEKKKRPLPDWLLKSSLWAFLLVFTVMLTLIYAIPLAFDIKNLIVYFLNK